MEDKIIKEDLKEDNKIIEFNGVYIAGIENLIKVDPKNCKGKIIVPDKNDYIPKGYH